MTNSAALSGQLDYSITSLSLCQYLFSIFFTFFQKIFFNVISSLPYRTFLAGDFYYIILIALCQAVFEIFCLFEAFV